MSTTAGDPTRAAGRAGLMLGMATVGFALNFWAWALLSPLAVSFTTALDLSAFQQSLLVAVPVVVGSLGRIPVGALTDRFGGRVMFPLVSLTTIVPVLYLGLSGHTSLAGLLVGGFLLGIGGTAFAVGVPFVNAWFPPERRGLAIGIFGAGMGGTAISALTTVKLFTNVGETSPFLITSAVLAAYAILAWTVLRDAPGRVVPTTSLVTATKLIDAVVYGSADPDATGLLDVLMGPVGSPARIQVDEGGVGVSDMRSIQRCGAIRLSGQQFGTGTPSPNAANSIICAAD